MKTIKLLSILFISGLTFTGCSSDDDGGHNHQEHEHEEPNVLRYVLTNTNNANDVVTLEFKDLDGEGGQDGVSTESGPLTANATYTGVLQLLHEESNGDTEDVGAEIAEDDSEEHEIFYVTNVTDLNINKTDIDTASNPLGFNTNATSGAASTGTLTVTVVHEPKKPNNGTIQDATSEGGTEDISATFNVTVQ